jgi:hypothetical protein
MNSIRFCFVESSCVIYRFIPNFECPKHALKYTHLLIKPHGICILVCAPQLLVGLNVSLGSGTRRIPKMNEIFLRGCKIPKSLLHAQ